MGRTSVMHNEYRTNNHRHKIMNHFHILKWLDSPQVQWYMKSSAKNIVYKLPHKLLNNLRLRILGNSEIIGKTQK